MDRMPGLGCAAPGMTMKARPGRTKGHEEQTGKTVNDVPGP
jgi:hypothetical protein